MSKMDSNGGEMMDQPGAKNVKIVKEKRVLILESGNYQDLTAIIPDLIKKGWTIEQPTHYNAKKQTWCLTVSRSTEPPSHWDTNTIYA